MKPNIGNLSFNLIRAHLEYVREMLIIQGITDRELRLIEFHYKTAMEHGYKHGYIDGRKKRMR